MTGASIETTSEPWASSLRDVKGRIRGLFTQKCGAASVTLFLDGLLGDNRRTGGWMRAEAAGDPGPWWQQAILGRGRWGADTLSGIVRDDIVENLATTDSVEVVDESGFLKQVKMSGDVARQYDQSIRRNISASDLVFFTTGCPGDTGIVVVEGHLRTIEDGFETAKYEPGLERKEAPSWCGWHRRVSLLMMAFAMMAVPGLSGCAGPVEVRTGLDSAMPRSALAGKSGQDRTISVAAPSVTGGFADEARRAVISALQKRGFQIAESAAQQVTVTLAERSAAMAVLTDEGAPLSHAKRQRLLQNCADRIQRLVIVFEAAGSEPVRAWAEEDHCKGSLADSLAPLAERAVAALAGERSGISYRFGRD